MVSLMWYCFVAYVHSSYDACASFVDFLSLFVSIFHSCFGSCQSCCGNNFYCRLRALVDDDAASVSGSWTGSTSSSGSAGVLADVILCVELASLTLCSCIFLPTA